MFMATVSVIIKLFAFALSGGILYRGFVPGNHALPATKIAGVLTSLLTLFAFMVDVDDFTQNNPWDKTEQLFWESIEREPNKDLYCAYLEKYPEGQFRGIAKVRLENAICPEIITQDKSLSVFGDFFSDKPSEHEATIEVTLNPKKINGASWDGLEGKPDIYIVVAGKSYRNERCKDSFTCQFAVTGVSQTVPIEVWDADAIEDDPAGKTLCSVGKSCQTQSAQLQILTTVKTE